MGQKAVLFFFICFSRASLLLFVEWRVPQILFFTVLSFGFPYFTNVVQLLCSLSGWLYQTCSATDTDLMAPIPIVELHTI